jgi:hypothetical protein
MPEERLSSTLSHRRKLRHTHIDKLVEWRHTFRTIASGRRRTHTGVVKIDRSINRGKQSFKGTDRPLRQS